MKLPYRMAPGALLDFQFDWTAWLARDGDFITSYEITPGPGVTVSSDQEIAGVVTAWLELVDTIRCTVTTHIICTVTTNAGRTDSRAIKLIAGVN